MSNAVTPGDHAHPEPSTTLLDGLRQGQEQAWQRFQVLYFPILRRWCRRANVPEAARDDVVQEVLRAVAANVANFSRGHGSGSFVAWLSSVTRTRIANHFSRQVRQPSGEGGSDHQQFLNKLPAPSGEPSSSLSPVPQRRLLMRRALDVVRGEVEPKTWQAFWATVIEERPTADVAAELGMTPEAVRKAKSRLLRRVREVVNEMAG